MITNERIANSFCFIKFPKILLDFTHFIIHKNTRTMLRYGNLRYDKGNYVKVTKRAKIWNNYTLASKVEKAPKQKPSNVQIDSKPIPSIIRKTQSEKHKWSLTHPSHHCATIATSLLYHALAKYDRSIEFHNRTENYSSRSDCVVTLAELGQGWCRLVEGQGRTRPAAAVGLCLVLGTFEG